MPKSLVTGGAGFMGSHVAESLLKQGHDVLVLDDLSGGFEDNVPKGAAFVQGSILDETLIKKLFQETSFDYVFHLAAYAAEGLSHFIKKFNYQNNLIGSINLINASILSDVKCFVFTSSIAVYGNNQLPMTEEMQPMPEDPYGISKYAVELDLAETQRMFGMPYVIFRPHNVYGERQNIGDKYRNVVGIFMNQIMHGKPMTIFGDGNQKRAFSYIGNVAPLIADCINRPKAYNQVFNIGADTPYTVNDLAGCVAKAFDVEPKIQYLDQRNEVVEAYCEHRKIAEYFDVGKIYSLEEGVQQMAQWAKKHGSRESPKFKNIEVSKNLPPSWR